MYIRASLCQHLKFFPSLGLCTCSSCYLKYLFSSSFQWWLFLIIGIWALCHFIWEVSLHLSGSIQGVREPAPTPLATVGVEVGEPVKCYPGQITMHERGFVEVQSAWGEIPAHHQSWKEMHVDTEERRNSARATPQPKEMLQGIKLSSSSNLPNWECGKQWPLQYRRWKAVSER